MTTNRKIDANRENARKSTGPRTAAGKAVVRGNAIKHALLTKALTFDTNEDEEDFKQLRADIRKELDPHGIVETMLVEEIIVSWWKQQAAQRWSMDGLVVRRRAYILLNTALYERKEVRWRTTKFGSKSGAIGIRRKATSKKSARPSTPVKPFAPSAKLLPSYIARKTLMTMKPMVFFGGQEGDADESQG